MPRESSRASNPFVTHKKGEAHFWGVSSDPDIREIIFFINGLLILDFVLALEDVRVKFKGLSHLLKSGSP